MEFKNIEGVPIVSTGTYPLGSGETTFTADDLASAVLAASDPTISAPRIKIGHLDKRFEADESLDGEPAMGTVRNMTLSEDGQTIIGDLVDVPAWLADSMQSAYPGRSIEGGLGYTAPSGHDYGLVISNLALLGTTWPGVGSLDDLRDVLQKNGPMPADTVEARSKRVVMAKVGDKLDAEDETEVKALVAKGLSRAEAEKKVKGSADEKRENMVKGSLDVGGIPRVFASDLRGGKVPQSGDLDQSKWWARSVEAADDGTLSILVDTAAGKLLRLPITVAEKALTYGEPTAVAASAGPIDPTSKGPRVLASWPSNSAEAKTMQIAGKDVDQAVVAKSLGLAEDADEATILDKLGVKAAATPPASTETETVRLPEGVVAIDSARLADLERKANEGASVAASFHRSERDAEIDAAITGGKIVAKSRETWEKRWDRDREETRAILASLTAVIPVGARETGRSGDGDGDPVAEEAVHAAIRARHFPELVQTTTEAA